MSYSVLMSWHLQLINHILNNYWWLHLIYPLATGQHTHLLPELFFAESLNFNKIAFIKLVLYVEPSLGPYSFILVCAFWNSNKLASEATHAYEVHSHDIKTSYVWTIWSTWERRPAKYVAHFISETQPPVPSIFTSGFRHPKNSLQRL